MKLQRLLNRSFNLLMTRTDRIGDLVLSTPVFEAIRKKYPESKITVLTFLENREILLGSPFIDEVLLYDKKGSEKSWWGNLLFSFFLRKKKFDLVIHLHATNRMHWLTWLAGIPVRIGWSRRLKWALTDPFEYVKKEGERHEAEYNFDLLRPLEISAPKILTPFFPIDSRAQKSVSELLAQKNISSGKPWIVISPGASDESKMWPAGKFSKVIDELNEELDAIFFAIGSRKDRTYVRQVTSEAKTPVFDLSGQLSLGMLGAFFKQTDLLISNDSGPVHIAGALKAPVISIFVREDPGLSATRWGGLGENTVNLKKLPVEPRDVIEVARKLLNVGAGFPRPEYEGRALGWENPAPTDKGPSS